MKPLRASLVVPATIAAALSAGCGPFGNERADGSATSGQDRPPAQEAKVDAFDSAAAWRLLKDQVALGPRPAGSPASRTLARRLRRLLPRGRFEPVPGGLRNVVGTIRGREPGYVVLGAHYDTKDIRGFVGANDAASGTAVAVQLARTLRRPRHTIHVILFDGEESPRGTPDAEFAEKGLRGSRAAAPRYEDARAMVLLDFVGDRELAIRRESYSNARIWRRLRAAARRVGAGAVFPTGLQGAIQDDHLPFIEQGVPSIDLIDFDFPCWHRRCDDLSAVSEKSLDAVGESVYELLASL